MLLTNIAAVNEAHQSTDIERTTSHGTKAPDQSQQQEQSWRVYLSEKAQQLSEDFSQLEKSVKEHLYYNLGKVADYYTSTIIDPIADILARIESQSEQLLQKKAELEAKRSQMEGQTEKLTAILDEQTAIYKSRQQELALLNRLAENPKDSQTLYAYSVMLATGQGGKVDMPKAAFYFKVAGELGHPLALYQYATLQGEGSEPDIAKAAAYVKYAADEGVAVAKDHYAMVLQFGQAMEKGPAQALSDQKRLADEGDRLAQHIYATMRKFGGEEWGEPNLPEARQYFKLSADQGFALAQQEYAQMLDEGLGGEANLPEAISYYQKAAAQENLNAMRRLTQLNQAVAPGGESAAEMKQEL
jgi:TPR repeat protein